MAFKGDVVMTKQIELTQGKVALVDDADFERLNQFNWHARKSSTTDTFYAIRNVSVGPYKQRTVLMHREILSVPTGMFPDHIDGNGLNNQRVNLRVCTHKQNSYNQAGKRGGSSRYKGVSWNKGGRKGKWQTEIKIGDQRIYLGKFDSEIEAAKAYDAAARKHFGEFARCNFPLEETQP